MISKVRACLHRGQKSPMRIQCLHRASHRVSGGMSKSWYWIKCLIMPLVPDQWDVCPYLGHYIAADISFLYFRSRPVGLVSENSHACILDCVECTKKPGEHCKVDLILVYYRNGAGERCDEETPPRKLIKKLLLPLISNKQTKHCKIKTRWN